MSTLGLGDLTQFYTSVRNTSALKNRLAVLSEEMSTGLVNDPARHLKGDLRTAFSFNREISLLSDYNRVAEETALTLGQMQETMNGLERVRSDLANRLLPIDQQTLPPQVDDAARAAEGAFADMVSSINRRFGDRTLFAGAAVDTLALADAETMMTDILATVGGATDAPTIMAAVDSWFDDPGGGFETVGYLGTTTGPVTRRVSAAQTVPLDAQADDPAMRATLKGAAYAAVAHRLDGVLSDVDKSDLAKAGGLQLADASAELTYLRARVGDAEAIIQTTLVTNRAEVSAFEMARSDLLKADPFETAVALQDIQVQLETHFATTGRLSRLTLANYI